MLDAATASPVAEICRRLDRIPLALELAAAVVHLSVAQLSARFGDALAVLSRHGHGHPDRQQTLAATLDWSHDLLLDDERVAFRRLAVFAGGFDLDAAAFVSAISDVIDVLSRLVDKSLVTAETTDEADRFRMHEVVRRYGEAQLRHAGELPACVERHRAWYAGGPRHDPDRGVPIVLEPRVVRLRNGQPARRLRQCDRRATLSGASARRQHMASPARADSWPKPWDGSPVLSRDARRSRRGDRALFAKAVLHLRRADPEPMVGLAHAITEASRSLGDDAMAIALDQESIFTLMAHDWASTKRQSMERFAQPDSAPAVAVGTRHFAAVLALALGEVDDARALLHEAGAALDSCPMRHRRSSPP